MSTEVCKKCGKPNPYRDYALSGPREWCLACVSDLRYARWDEKEIQERLIRGGVPDKYLTIRDSPLASKRRAMVQLVFQQQQPIFLQGAVSSGKTLALAILARELVMRNTPILYLHCAKTADHLRGNNDAIARYTTLCQQAGHLLLDDVGTENDKTGWWAAWLGNIVNCRFDDRRPTSGSTNMDIHRLEARLARRLTEGALVFSNMKA